MNALSGLHELTAAHRRWLNREPCSRAPRLGDSHPSSALPPRRQQSDEPDGEREHRAHYDATGHVAAIEIECAHNPPHVAPLTKVSERHAECAPSPGTICLRLVALQTGRSLPSRAPSVPMRSRSGPQPAGQRPPARRLSADIPPGAHHHWTFRHVLYASGLRER